MRFQEAIGQSLDKLINAQELGVDSARQLIERPQNPEHGDLAFPCFLLAKARRQSPVAVAQGLADELKKQGLPDGIGEVLATGPYLNFRLSAAAAWAIVAEVWQQGEAFGGSSLGRGQKVLLEYSSPNIAKEFHIGHFRNTILGQALANIHNALGFEVTAINHLGDWGSQFGKVMYAYKHWGDEAELQQGALAYLTKLYVRFHEEAEKNPDLDREARLCFKALEAREPEYVKLWQQFNEMSVNDLKRIYARLGARFDHFLGESFYIDKVDSLLALLRKKNLLVESDGAQIVSLEDYKMSPCLILTGDGTTLYHTRDLAAALYRYERFKFDRCLYVVGSEQTLHFQQLFKVLELLELPWAKTLEHVRYGLYRFKDGKFSTRKGRVVLFQEVADEAQEKVLGIIQEKNPGLANREQVADSVALGALVFHDLSTDRGKDVEFDWAKILDFEGDTGPYVQYAHARASAILRKGNFNLEKARSVSADEGERVLFAAESALRLAKTLGQFPLAVMGAQRLLKPSIVAHYALDLAKAFNSFYRGVRVLGEGDSVKIIEARLALVGAAKLVLSSALKMICIEAPEEM